MAYQSLAAFLVASGAEMWQTGKALGLDEHENRCRIGLSEFVDASFQ